MAVDLFKHRTSILGVLVVVFVFIAVLWSAPFGMRAELLRSLADWLLARRY